MLAVSSLNKQSRSSSVEDRLRRMTPVAASPEQIDEFRQFWRKLIDDNSKSECILMGPNGERISMPETAFYVLKRVIEVMASGDAVTIVPVGKQLTTQQAANILNVSRQYLVKLLDSGRIPYTKTGKHRRLNIEDVLEFKEKRDQERKVNLDELTNMSEAFGGYSELE